MYNVLYKNFGQLSSFMS